MAYDAGVNIISMSIGSNQPWAIPNSILSKLIKKITENGVSGMFKLIFVSIIWLNLS